MDEDGCSIIDRLMDRCCWMMVFTCRSFHLFSLYEHLLVWCDCEMKYRWKKKTLPYNTSAQLQRTPNTHTHTRTRTHTGCFRPTWFTVFEAVSPAMNRPSACSERGEIEREWEKAKERDVGRQRASERPWQEQSEQDGGGAMAVS